MTDFSDLPPLFDDDKVRAFRQDYRREDITAQGPSVVLDEVSEDRCDECRQQVPVADLKVVPGLRLVCSQCRAPQAPKKKKQNPLTRWLRS